MQRADVVVATNFVPPYRAPVFDALAERVPGLALVVDTAVERNRAWAPSQTAVPQHRTRGLSISRGVATAAGRESRELHLPVGLPVLLTRLRPRAVVSSEMGLRSWLCALWCLVARRPFYLWLTLSERTESHRPAWQHATRRLLARLASGAVVHSDSAARYARSLRRDLRLVQHPQVTPLPEGHEPVVGRRRTGELLCVGQLVERKAVLPAVQALAAAQLERPVHLHLVGEGPLAEAVAATTGPGLTTTLHGHVPYEQVQRWYGSADALLFPSLEDEWGLVVNEALAAGMPVLGSTGAAAVPSLVEDGVNGRVHEPGDAAGLVASVRWLQGLSDEEYQAVSRAAVRSVRGATVEGLADALAELVGRGPGRSR